MIDFNEFIKWLLNNPLNGIIALTVTAIFIASCFINHCIEEKRRSRQQK